eukprot:555469-Pleurochrysis_carterae.AAC.2
MARRSFGRSALHRCLPATAVALPDRLCGTSWRPPMTSLRLCCLQRRLLDNEEEVKLAAAVKELLRWLSVRRSLVDDLGRQPSRREWAMAVGGFGSSDEVGGTDKMGPPATIFACACSSNVAICAADR